MQCKDIPIAPVLAFIAKVERGETYWTPSPEMALGWGTDPIPHSSATWFWSEDYKPENSVVRGMPEGVNEKLALAKMRKLIAQGYVSGCACGCRGDFELTDKGREALTH